MFYIHFYIITTDNVKKENERAIIYVSTYKAVRDVWQTIKRLERHSFPLSANVTFTVAFASYATLHYISTLLL